MGIYLKKDSSTPIKCTETLLVSDVSIFELDKHKLLTTQEAAVSLKLKPNTLAKWRCQGTHPELCWVKIGSRCLYSREAVKNFIHKNIKTTITSMNQG